MKPLYYLAGMASFTVAAVLIYIEYNIMASLAVMNICAAFWLGVDQIIESIKCSPNKP